MAGLRSIVLLLLLGLSARSEAAEEVVLEHRGLDLLGSLEIAPGKSLANDGTVLLVHGTLAHHRMEIIAALQSALRSRGINSLAVTLGLGLDRRKGMFDCSLEHDHRHSDAVEEIETWVEWLTAKGAKRVALAGHSRGGHQAAVFVAEKSAAPVGRLILLAPLVNDADEVAAQYVKVHKRNLSSVREKAKRILDSGEGDLLMEKVGFLSCPDAKVTAAAFLDYYAVEPQHALGEILKRIERPVLLIAGSGDDIVPDLVARMRQAKLPPTVEIATVAGADHFFRDLFVEDVADYMKEFLAKP